MTVSFTGRPDSSSLEAFLGRPTFLDGEAAFEGDALRAGDAFRAGEAFRAGDDFFAGDGFLVGDVRLATLEGEAFRAGEAFLTGGGDGVRLRAVDFRPRLAVSAGPGTTPELALLVAGAPPLVARRLSIPLIFFTRCTDKSRIGR